ncbi:MAG: DUF1294 domain-containing protein [Planctomycetota bacterium]
MTWTGLAAVLTGGTMLLSAVLPGPTSYWYVGAINGTTFLLYVTDKLAAKLSLARVPEAVLHGLALLGGSGPALLGQRLVRHKTQKRSFQKVFWAIVAIHVALAAVAGWLWAVEGASGWAFAALTGWLKAVNMLAGWLYALPDRPAPRWQAVAPLLALLGGGIGAAIADRRRNGRNWLPYLAGAMELVAAVLIAFRLPVLLAN